MQIGLGWVQFIKSGLIFIVDFLGKFALFGGDKVSPDKGGDSVALHDDDDEEDFLNWFSVEDRDLSKLVEGWIDEGTVLSFWRSFCFGLLILQ